MNPTAVCIHGRINSSTICLFQQSDAKAGFLRSARDGHLDKILEHLKNNTDINTSNSVCIITSFQYANEAAAAAAAAFVTGVESSFTD